MINILLKPNLNTAGIMAQDFKFISKSNKNVDWKVDQIIMIKSFISVTEKECLDLDIYNSNMKLCQYQT